MQPSARQFQLWQRLRRRMVLVLILVGFVFFALIFRLAQIQVVKGEEYYEKSQRVIRKVVPLTAPRGEMFTRDYTGRESAEYLVSNTTTLNLIAIPSHFNAGELHSKTRQLEKLLNRPKGTLVKKITENKIEQNDSIVLIENLTEKEHTVIADYYLNFIKFIVRQSTRRYYHYPEAMAHITGYVGPPTKKDIQRGIKSYQRIGKNGLEAYYDTLLRGEDGEIVQIKTARGEIEEQKVFKNFKPGKNLVLTIDKKMQLAAAQGLQEKTGAVVALKPHSGEIIALASSPKYNPNTLVSAEGQKREKHLQYMREKRAELNRAIAAKYPPASTFKPLVALSALEERRTTADKVRMCPGKFVLESTYEGFPDTTFHCWDTHGHNNLVGAIADSCSVYFYKLGYQIGAEPIIKYSRYFKLDTKTQVDLPSEIPGFIPSRLWKEKEHGTRWFDGDTVNLSIGQGFVQTTVLGMTNFYASLVTGGVVYKPHFLKAIRRAEDDKLQEAIDREILYELPISKNSLQVLRKSLRKVVTRGTAEYVFRNTEIPVAGKTGTVQTRSADRFAKYSQHAWFIGYAPFKGKPENQIVVAAFVEKGIGGAATAAPLARRLFETWEKQVKEGAEEK